MAEALERAASMPPFQGPRKQQGALSEVSPTEEADDYKEADISDITQGVPGSDDEV